MIPEKKKKMEVADEDSEDIDGELVRSTEKLQEKRAELERVSVCQKCGVAGFAELLIFCEQCQVSAEHCYCLDEFPDIDDDFTWSCEECVPRVISSLDKVIMHPTRKSERITQKRKKRWDKKCTEAEVELQQFDVAFTQQPSELQTKDVSFAPELQQCDVAFTQQPSELRTKDVPHAPELQQCDVTFTQQPPELRAKDVPLAPVPLITDSSLQSEESRSSHICEDTNGDRKLKRKRRRLVLEDGEISDEDTEYEQVEQMQIHPDVGEAPNSMLPVEYNVDGAPNSMLPAECNVDGDAPKSMLPVECNDGDAPMSMLPVECNVGDALMNILPVDSDVGDVAKSMLEVHSDTGDKNMLQVNTYVGNTSKSLLLSSASVGVHTYVHARPVIDPVWRGCFDISNEKYGRAVAHLTNKACLKVWEGANALSPLPLLYAEMLSRLDAWPNSFAEVAPTDDNIALYFFPESERDFENFDELVNEMIDLDLALKVFLDNAELLIFPSYQLPQQYWRFGGRYYLWGVFRGRKNPAPAKSAEPLLICDKGAECMDEARNSSVRTWRRTSPLSPLSTSSSYG